MKGKIANQTKHALPVCLHVFVRLNKEPETVHVAYFRSTSSHFVNKHEEICSWNNEYMWFSYNGQRWASAQHWHHVTVMDTSRMFTWMCLYTVYFCVRVCACVHVSVWRGWLKSRRQYVFAQAVMILPGSSPMGAVQWQKTCTYSHTHYWTHHIHLPSPLRTLFPLIDSGQ